MTVSPHPIVLTNVIVQRRSDLLAGVDRERLAQQAAGEFRPRPPWADSATIGTLGAVLALLPAIARSGT